MYVHTGTRKWEVKVVASDRVDKNLRAAMTKEGHRDLSERRQCLLSVLRLKVVKSEETQGNN